MGVPRVVRVRTLLLVAGCAIAHGVLTLVAISQGLIIFRGPSTASEKFWAALMDVLLFPGTLFLGVIRANVWQVVLAVANSLVWGIVLAGVYLQVRRKYRRKRTPNVPS
jgi:hypothetical protein